jgi:hypothetical protein
MLSYNGAWHYRNRKNSEKDGVGLGNGKILSGIPLKQRLGKALTILGL